MKTVYCTLMALAFQSSAMALTCTDSAVPPGNPDNIYQTYVDGTVTDTRTRLTWKRCPEGTNWNGGSCVGQPINADWAQALAIATDSSYAGYQWRLPNLKELRSLVEECRNNPAINDTIFPSTPSSRFWSATPSPYTSLVTWSLADVTLPGTLTVNFSEGIVSLLEQKYWAAVRLVRVD